MKKNSKDLKNIEKHKKAMARAAVIRDNQYAGLKVKPLARLVRFIAPRIYP